MIKPVALSIAGFDSGNGAGVETDIKVYEIMGVHGVGVTTAITSQNTLGISQVFPIPSEVVKRQLEALLSDFEVKSAKLGMVYTKEQFNVVVELLADKIPLVTDPVIYAKDGTPLIKDIEDYKKVILPRTTVLTPNAVEASILSGVKVMGINDAEKACKELSRQYNIPYVIVKGGHMEGEYSIDVLYDGERDQYFKIGYKRIVYNKNTHGTGSVFATAISAGLAKGKDVVFSFRSARELLQKAIYYGLNIGKGIGPVDPITPALVKSMKFEVIEEMHKFAYEVEQWKNFYKLIPEVQSNLAHSIDPDFVTGLEDIAVFRDRIVRNWDNKVKVGLPVVFGKPTHTARLLLSIMKFNKGARVLINIKFTDEAVRLLKEIGYEVIEVNRELEPNPQIEGKSMEWLVNHVYMTYGDVPNVIFDRGVKGKEAMIRLWTSSVEEILSALKYLSDRL
ncbi:MAG: bifunctional hydroxymethylpyrimidine kinase/phosphomethylpyrimidine kinase [Sulfolobaceae archaeon]